MFKAGFRKGRGTRDQIANIGWIMEKAREFQKNIYFCFTDYAKAFDCVQFSSVAQSCLTLCDPMNHSMPALPVHHQLKLMSIESVIPSNHLTLCPPLLFLTSIFPSIRGFSNESTSHQVAKVLELQLQHQSFQ